LLLFLAVKAFFVRQIFLTRQVWKEEMAVSGVWFCLIVITLAATYVYFNWRSKCKHALCVYNSKASHIAKLVESLDILKHPYIPTFWLAWGHAQTITSAIFRPIQGYAPWKREVITVKASKYIDVDGPLALDWITPPGYKDLSEDAPILLLVPGLSGDTWSQYIHVFGWKSAGAYRVVCVNFRGGAGIPTTSCQMFGAVHTDDLRQAILHIAEEFPKANLFCVGVSLGAVLLLKYAAEEGENHIPQLKGMISLSSTYDSRNTTRYMNETFMGRYVYSM
jgi:predicted alpha/beta-fold hydrolase